jgi:hypothetical protein
MLLSPALAAAWRGKWSHPIRSLPQERASDPDGDFAGLASRQRMRFPTSSWRRQASSYADAGPFHKQVADQQPVW